jgi:predicted nicotinamide N-methyase
VRFRIGRRLSSPTGFTVTWTGTTATFSWISSSADTAADVPANYVLEAGTAPGESNVAMLNLGNRTTFTTEVPSGTYYVRIRAENAEGESDPSDEIEVRTPGTPQGPTGLISVSESGIVDLRWTAATANYGATGYVIEAGSAPGLSDLARLQVGNVTQFTTTAPPGVYYVRVRAIYDSGTSLPSNEIVVRR